MPTYKAGSEGQEVPLAASSLEYCLGIDVHLVENNSKLVNKGDVEITLGVFYNLGSLSNVDTLRFMCPGGNDFIIKSIDEVSNFWRRAGGDLFDAGDTMFFIARVNTLRTVTTKEVFIKFKV